MTELNALADRILAAVRDGAHLHLDPLYVHRRLVNETGGTPAWEAMKADLAQAEKEFVWC